MLSIQLQPFPELNTERLTLKQLHNDHSNDIYILRSDQYIMKYINIPLIQSIEEAESLIEKLNNQWRNKEGITWGISNKGEDKIIGTILFKHIDAVNHRAEVGYLLSAAYWRKGIIQEALTTVLQYGFNTLNLHSIEAIVNPENIASIGVLEKNNFIKEAHFKENFYSEGDFLDSAVYSLLKSNFK